MVNLTNFFDRI